MKSLIFLILLIHCSLPFARELTQDSELVQTCGACHGIDGNSPLPVAPNLAGQAPGYLLYELRSYKNHNRVDEFMGDIINPLTDEDLMDLVAYYKKQKFAHFPPDKAPDQALVTRGHVLFDLPISRVGLSCADCHGDNAEGAEYMPRMKDIPRLAGQPYDYLVSNLHEYSHRMKHYSMLGMKVVAESLSDDDIKALASYLSSLR